PLLRIIHGHGTGRLKAALRDYLKDSPYVGAFRAGERPEGGDGVTIVELK
ncbi:MAG: Smr/MutS family protein, partial [Candidatus Methylomirabilis sp.]